MLCTHISVLYVGENSLCQNVSDISPLNRPSVGRGRRGRHIYSHYSHKMVFHFNCHIPQIFVLFTFIIRILYYAFLYFCLITSYLCIVITLIYILILTYNYAHSKSIYWRCISIYSIH